MKEIIQKMRHDADRIARERYQEWWDSLTPAEQTRQRRAVLEAESDEATEVAHFKPGVIELDPHHPTTPYTLQMQLMMHDIFVPLVDLAAQTQEERDLASLWCATVMLSASDNDVVIAPRPQWLPARDASGWEHGIKAEGRLPDLVLADIASHGGEDAAKLQFDAAFRPVMVVGERAVRFEVGDLEYRLREIVDSLRMIPPPETTAANADWLEEWIDRGCPMIDPVDTSVDGEFSARSTDGNDIRTVDSDHASHISTD